MKLTGHLGIEALKYTKPTILLIGSKKDVGLRTMVYSNYSRSICTPQG